MLFYVRLFQSEAFTLVYNFQEETQYQSDYTEGCQHHKRRGVVELSGVCYSGIGLVQYFTDEQREEPKADVLNPEYQGIGRTYDFGVY